ncbi:phosphoglycerate mutase [Pediococcus stilesii]|uniref:Phosphoglycerate mutase n=2 Tax=Pediococcus stilesii TaxID=331679 RepID=A0A0R2KWY3_9LACO|nr:phosphoglycerate mutase [Pediococcus stilesii]
MSMTVHLYLVRHGQTELNRSFKLQGRTNSALTLKGIRDVRKLADRLNNIKFDRAFSSFSGRASETARIIVETHPELREVEAVDGLAEYDFGGLENRSVFSFWWAVIHKIGPLGIFRLFFGKHRVRNVVRMFNMLDKTNSAETMPEVSNRVLNTVREIIDKELGNPQRDFNVLIVSHGLILSAFLYGINPKKVPRLLLKNASVSQVDFKNGQFKIVSVNKRG